MAENHSTIRRVVALATVLLFGLIAWRGKFDDEAVCSLLALFCVPAIAFALTERLELLPPICRPFLKYGALGKLAGRVLYPGWPTGVLFTTLLLLLAAGVYLLVPTARPFTTMPAYRVMSNDIVMLIFAGTLLLPGLVLRLFAAKVRQNFAFYLLIAVILGAITLALGMLGDATDDDSYLWFFSWVPSVKLLLMDMIRHDFHSPPAGVPAPGPGAEPNYTSVLITGLITTGAYLLLLLVCAFRQFPYLNQIEEEAEGHATPTTQEDSPEPTTTAP